ncbi:LysR family transcriptional regulator [Nonomuraea cavernae]|uniref:LysR family transcriptional regulator n=1 Tax=Nonomuraea cavernae TaxID=2045107 RepID=UPI0033E1E3C9
MTFTQLRILVTVARTGNMTRAADELATTQSAVSHALRLLESELGLTLFTRNNHGVTPTGAGRAAIRRAVLILAQLDALEQEAAAARGESRGRLRVGVIPSANASLLPRVLRAFTTAHPGVTLTVLEGSDEEVLDWLVTGAVDVATLTTVAPGPATTPFARDRMLAVLPAAHRLSSRPTVAVTDLARHPFIMSTGGCEPLITDLVRRAGASLRCHYRVRDTGSILALVAEDLGVSIIPELALPARTTGVCAIPLEPEETRTILLGLPEAGAASPMATALTALALDEVPPAHRCH